MNDTATSPLTCPKCGSARTHHSHRRTLAERLPSLLGARMKRCHECNVRFMQLHGSTLLVTDLRAIIHRLAWVGLTILALFAVLAAVVWFSNKQAAPSENSACLFSPALMNGNGTLNRA